jgi:hypothetical protein
MFSRYVRMQLVRCSGTGPPVTDQDRVPAHSPADYAHSSKQPAQHRAAGVAWWRRGDSNPCPMPCKGIALPSELRPRMGLTRLERVTSRLSGECSNQAELQTPLHLCRALTPAQ